MPATTFKIAGERIDRALAMHDQGMSCRDIARALDVPVATLQNALSAALCVRSGRVPAERKPSGRLSDIGRSRLREALREGLRGTEIQLLLGVAAVTVSKERAVYNADLKRRRKKPLPPVGRGERYGGARLPKETFKEIERLLLEGWSSRAIAAHLGISKTPCLAVRTKLVKRAERRGQHFPAVTVATSHSTQSASSRPSNAPSPQPTSIAGPAPKLPMSFEEQLAAVAAGRGLVATFRPRRPDPAITLGGVASGILS